MARTLIRFVPIIPAEREYPLNRWDRFEKMVTAWMQGPLDAMLRAEFEKTTKNWSSGPVFVGKFSRPRNVMWQLVVDPKGPGTLKWTRVSAGVKKHSIYPRRGPLLHFQRSYSPHTKPGGRWGGSGTKGGAWVHTPAVTNWPGIKPREFSLEIKKSKEKEVQSAFEKILRTAFH